MRLGSVVKPQDALVALALANQLKVTICQKVRHRFRDWRENLFGSLAAIKSLDLHVGTSKHHKLKMAVGVLQK